MYFIFWTIIELYLFSWCVKVLGFGTSLLIYAAPSFVGFFLLALLSRKTLQAYQQMQAQGGIADNLPNSMLHVVLQYFGGILLIIPSALTRIFGLFLVLPGIRHMLIWIGKAWFVTYLVSKATGRGGLFFQFGGMKRNDQSFSGPEFQYRGPQSTSENGEGLRDVTPKKLDQISSSVDDN